MPTAKLTRRLLDSIDNTTHKDVFYRDTMLSGFGVKVTPRNKIAFIAEARIKRGKSKRLTLGHYPMMNLEQARTIAQEKLLLLKQGDDPGELDKQKKEQRERDAAIKVALSVSLSEVFDSYLQARNLKPKSIRDYTNTVKLCFSDWMEQPVRDISRKHVEDRFYHIKKTAGKAQAAKAMRYLSAVLNYAKADEIDGERLIKENPCDVLKDKKIDRRIAPRTNYLDKPVLRELVEELYQVRHPDYVKQEHRITNLTVADYLVLLLFTGLRRDEATALEWDRVNLKDKLFVIEDTKNGQTHVVPMSSPVEKMLLARSEAPDRHEQWVFLARGGKGHLKEPRYQIAKISEIIGHKFTSHDLRRTFATLAESYGLDHYAIKRALNHKTQDITETYIQGRAEKMRQLFDAIAHEIYMWTYEEPPDLDYPKPLDDNQIYKDFDADTMS